MKNELQRVIKTPGAILMGLGSIIGTGIFVSIAIATQVAGNGLIIAIIIAAALAAFNGLSSAQLAAAHPVSGGTYEYGYRFLGSYFGFSAGLMFLIAKSASAATAVLVPEEVVTGTPEEESQAHAQATMILSGSTLHVHGSFTGLSSQLRDIEETPDDPGIHFHPGARGEENSYIYGLEASLNEDERSGTFHGTFTLTDEELVLLLDDRLYLDIHTVQFNPGEVRGQIEPADAAAAQKRLDRLSITPDEVDASAVASAFCRFIPPSLASIR